jgi:peptide deformylase
VKRPEFIQIKYQDETGAAHIEEMGGLMARAIQHEIDHLKGVFIVDRVTKTVKMTVEKDLKRISEGAASRAKTRKAFVL